MKKWSFIMCSLAIVLFVTMTIAQPVTADFFEVNAKNTFDNTITWVSFSDVVAVDIKGQTVFWDVTLYRESFTDTLKKVDGTDSITVIHFQILLTKRLGMDFPSQALPIKNLKGAMKDESEVQLGLTYTGKEQ